MIAYNIQNNQIIVEHTNGVVDFISYSSHVARINKAGELILAMDWDYSNTTLKWLREFLRAQGFSYLAGCSKKEIQAMIDNKEVKYKKNIR